MNDEHPAAPKFCIVLDRFVERCGSWFAWLNVLLVAVILIQVVLRYVFAMGLVYLEELQWHIFGVLIMFGIGYGITVDAHIRLDLLHRRMRPRVKAIVEILGILFLLMPLVAILFIHGIDFVESAYRVAERSDSPLGLPFRWLIKAVIPISMAYIAIAALSRLVRVLAFISNRR